MYLIKSVAIAECIISNACYTVWDFNACKAGAILERTLSNACNAVGCYIFTDNVQRDIVHAALVAAISIGTILCIFYCKRVSSGSIKCITI